MLYRPEYALVIGKQLTLVHRTRCAVPSRTTTCCSCRSRFRIRFTVPLRESALKNPLPHPIFLDLVLSHCYGRSRDSSPTIAPRCTLPRRPAARRERSFTILKPRPVRHTRT